MRLIDQGLDAIIQNQPDLGGLALGGAIAAGLAALGWATVGWVDPESKDEDPDAPWIVLGYTMGADGQPHKFETEGQALDWAFANEEAPGVPWGSKPVVFTESGNGIQLVPRGEYLNKGWTQEQAREARKQETLRWAQSAAGQRQIDESKRDMIAKLNAVREPSEFYVGRDGITRSIYDREDDG